MTVCPNCRQRERWWWAHYFYGVLPGYLCRRYEEGKK